MSFPSIQRLDAADASFDAALNKAISFDESLNKEIEVQVESIIHRIREEGDGALLELTRRFDARNVDSVEELALSEQRLTQALEALSSSQREALQSAAKRIKDYHYNQVQESWYFEEPDGTVLGQQITPLDRVGVYVPGGKAAYPSTVLMNVLPAKVAGVSEVIMVVPAPEGQLNDMVLAAAKIAGVDKVFTVGGAQAVAALAYGTELIPSVDKIVGPGNIYVATAKRQVFGKVGIDMIAGPSEVLVIADQSANPDWVAMDLFSQAEHDEQAQAILIATDADFLDQVADSMQRQIEKMLRKAIIETSLENRGLFVRANDLDQAIDIANRIAPEHLELAIENARSWLPKIKHAGAIFCGHNTPEAFGDYCAGPNHVLPTSGTARFSSPLGVYDFQKRSSIIDCSVAGANVLGKVASELAHGEGLTAHAASAEYRIQGPAKD